MKNDFLQKYNKNTCNGCGVCTTVCSVDAIHMKEDDEGFLYPKIDEKKCIKCNRCKNICSNFNLKNEYDEKVYASYSKNQKELKESSSGGMFYILAKYVINKKGIVFGVKYNEKLVAEHDYAESLEKCKEFRGSKYVRSDLKDSYVKVKQFLNLKRIVLFTGTPCQCNGLKTYLGKEYENLITCDIICHANPSPKVFKKYINELETRKGQKIKNIYFRSKENGWKNQMPIIEYENGEKIEENSYYIAFVNELIGRPSCHECPFASKNRVTDFTIGDLWGFDKMEIESNNDKGLSLFTINSKKAENIFENIKNDMQYEEIDKKKAYSYNHYKNVNPNKNRDKFFNIIDKNRT